MIFLKQECSRKNILKRKEIKYDYKTKSLSEKSRDENRTYFSDWKIKYESGTDRGCFRSLEARELIKISVLNNCGMIRENWLRSSQEEHVLKLYR